MLDHLIPLIMEDPATATAIGVPILTLLIRGTRHYLRKRRMSKNDWQLVWLVSGLLLFCMTPWPSLWEDMVGPSVRPSIHAVNAASAALLALIAFSVTASCIAMGVSDHAYYLFGRFWRWFDRKLGGKPSSTGFEPVY